MNRFGKILVAVAVLALIGLASITRVTGPVSPKPAVASATPAAPKAGWWRGRLAIPIEGVRARDLRDSFDEPRGGGARLHHAIDIMAPAGATIHAAADGIIEKLHDSEAGGLMIYQRIAPDRIVYYAHLARYSPGLAEGMRVAAGAPLGEVGASGDADPGAPHLHLGVKALGAGEHWWQGADIDPYPLLAGGPAPR